MDLESCKRRLKPAATERQISAAYGTGYMVDLNSPQECPSQSLLGGGEGVWGRVGEPWTENSPGPPPKNLDSAALILIGTVHGDPRGYERVLGLLKCLRPDVVTVEISRFSLRYRRAWEGRWRRLLNGALVGLPPGADRHPAIRRVAAQITLPFEYRAARDYSRLSGAKCLPLDLGGLSRRHLPRYGRELLSTANLRALTAEPQDSLEDWVAREFRRARLAWQRSPWRLAMDSTPETLRRERFLARRLERLAGQGGRIAHLGGWEHLVPWRDGQGFLSWLDQQKPCILWADEEALVS
jgi:hypothetical protein